MTPGAPSSVRIPVDVFEGLASMQTGVLVECDATGAARQRLEDFAATIPSLFGAGDLAPLECLLSRFGGESAEVPREVLIVSAAYVHVMKPIARRRGIALVVMSPATNNVGLVLSAVHERAARLEGG